MNNAGQGFPSSRLSVLLRDFDGKGRDGSCIRQMRIELAPCLARKNILSRCVACTVMRVDRHTVQALWSRVTSTPFFIRCAISLRISSVDRSTSPPNASGPKIQTGSGLVPKMSFPTGV